MSRRKCCCGCLVYTDDFNRPNSTDLGDNWTELRPEFNIYNEMLEVSGFVPVARYNNVIPDKGMTVYAMVKDVKPGLEYVLYGNMDASGYNFTSLTYTEVHPASGYLRLMRSINSSSFPPENLTELESITFAYQQMELEDRFVGLCIDDNITRGWVQDNAMCRVMADTILVESGIYAGIGIGSGIGYFDDFEVRSKYIPDTACLPCIGCLCGSTTPPLNLVATYEGSGICDTLDGTSVPLNHLRCGADEDQPWVGYEWNGGCLNGLVGQYMILRCSGAYIGNPYAWTLEVPTNACASYTIPTYPSVATCDPFMMEFDFFFASNTPICPNVCWPCGEDGGAEFEVFTSYKITVTERMDD